MKYYIMTGESIIEEYAAPGPAISCLGPACERSEFQLLNRSPLDVEISQAGGVEFPDFLLHARRIPLVSERLRQTLLELGADYLFWKPVNLLFSPMGIREPYWLALPPRLDCLERDECDIEIDASDCPSWEKRHFARKIVINDKMRGNYEIFKLPPDMYNHEIIVTEPVKKVLEAGNFSNLYFYPLERESA